MASRASLYIPMILNICGSFSIHTHTHTHTHTLAHIYGL
jgi:hypothetical protein